MKLRRKGDSAFGDFDAHIEASEGLPPEEERFRILLNRHIQKTHEVAKLKAENEQQMVDFFAQNPDAKEIKIDADWGIEQIHGRQLLPAVGRGDGFYYCLIQKTA